MATAQELVKQHRFLMLSKSWCPDCHYAIAVFKKYNVLDKITLVELDKMPPKEAGELEKQFTALSGRKWVPTIFFNGEVFGTEQTLKELESRDMLPGAFEKAGTYSGGVFLGGARPYVTSKVPVRYPATVPSNVVMEGSSRSCAYSGSLRRERCPSQPPTMAMFLTPEPERS
ncbi:hypothetical protein KL925_000626 [Ogataea polymorpha]|nr:hypothetical protein KL935_000143 [Ogataea polymorpha]KAG7908493.1 hypothetical protein KL907_001983 [Ogataea polymorpha]KAG7908775.1 hypothetical protein KL906_003006 [Ogataea polymorpha]KAG7920898.1 hypothetical protein KL927_000142 [Ogataea polymorpha]KAG7929884.1 hypothetical protein KL925_000626 [Ogataea polymorpha]